MQRIRMIAATAALLLASAAAQADIVLPALYLETRLFSLWSVGIGLIFACILVRALFAFPLWRAVLAAVLAKTASTLAGAVLMPLAGLAWELPARIYRPWFGWGGFDPLSWGLTLLLACLIHGGVEALAYRYGFKQPLRRPGLAWIFALAALSVALAFASLYLAPID
jgi:hypothetical protein